jgi:DNA adenine methylase
MNNVSPLRYPGGKTRACKILDEIVNNYFDMTTDFDTVVSPFVGGGSFEFYLQNKYNYSLIVNDKFTPLYNFWKQVKNGKEELCDRLRQKLDETVSKEDFIHYRENIIQLDDNAIEQAVLYFIINRCSFSGATLSGGFSEEASKKRFTTSSIDRIQKLNLDMVTIYNQDFTEFIEREFKEKCLLFLDPPYYLGRGSKLYGKNGDMHEQFEHEKLFDILKTKKNWIMTYNNCEYIRELYKDFDIIDAEWAYGMNKSKESSEIVIVSN